MSKPITIPGIGQFPSYTAAGKALGVTAQGIRHAERTNRLDKIGQKFDYSIEYGGVKYNSINDAARILKIPYQVIWEDQRRKRGGVVSTPHRKNPVHALGKTWLSISQLAHHLNVKYHYVYFAVKANKLEHYLETPIVFEGVQYHSIHEAATAKNRSWHYVEKRVVDH